jgi:hypothetical protein
MFVILKKSVPSVLSALILVTSLKGGDAAARGIRGSQQDQLNSLAISDDIIDIVLERDLKGKKGKGKGKGKGKSKSKSKGKGLSSAGSAMLDIASRFDIPADTPAPAPTVQRPTLTTWVEGCEVENRALNTCASNTNLLCKQCLFALSFTSTTPEASSGGVKACARGFCDPCPVEDLSAFFACGYEIMNPTVPDSSIRTPPPTNATAATAPSQVAPVTEDSTLDMENCPSVYPGSGEKCVMIAGYESKKCFYYEVGSDVVCQCNTAEPIWECTGTITNEEYIVETEEEVLPSLPTVDVVVSRMDP